MRRHFAQFDDELQDSDQTLSMPTRHLRPRARLSTVADTSDRSSNGLLSSSRRFPTSAFFSESTDDDFSHPTGRNQLSKSAYTRRNQNQTSISSLHMSTGPRERRRRSTGTSHVPRLHVDAIQFPVTRSVLWDRRRLASTPIKVSVGQVLPRFIVSAEALKEIYRLFGEKDGVRSYAAPLCYLYGDASLPRVKKVVLEGVKVKREEARAAGAWCIPVHTVQDGKVSCESYAATITAVQSSYRDEYADDVASKLQPKLLVFRSSSHAAQLDFQLECAVSPVLFQFSLVRNLPLLMTPLAVSLAKRELSTRSSNMRSGYLTLDRTRKAVPLLKVDPLVLQQPLVGIWIYGVHIDDAWDDETVRRQLGDALLYFACLGYMTSQAIKERVGPEKNTFLVALYPSNDTDDRGTVGSLPRFFECSFSEFLSPSARPLPMELYSNHRSCLVGVSKFSSDVDFILSASPTNEWEDARRQAKIPTISLSKETQDPEATDDLVDVDTGRSLLSRDCSFDADGEEQGGDVTRGWTITSDAIRKPATADLNTQSHASLHSEEDLCNVAISADTMAREVKEKPPIITSDDVHDVTCVQAATEASRTSPNETEDAADRSQRERLANDSSTSYRSCCKTQQLLTIQHQQILENQQRQLHEMQEQISQLRRLLSAARSSSRNEAPPSSKDDADASNSSIGAVSDVSTTFSRQGNDHLSPQSSMVSGRDDPLSDKSSVCIPQENEEEDADNERLSESDVSISSLGLSSISSGSDADLSSLSSSLVGERMKQLESSRWRGEEKHGVEQVGSEILNRSQPPVSAGKQNVEAPASMDVEPQLPSESGHQGLDDIEKDTSAHDLSIGELSASSNEEIIKVGDTLVDHDEDDDRDADNYGNDCSIVERLLSPDAYLRKVGGFVDHHGGCFTTPPLDFHSFCVPRIKFSSEEPQCSLSDSEDEEVRLIEQKYKRLMAA